MVLKLSARRRNALAALALLPAVLAALGFGGAYAAPLDSLAHFRFHLSVAALIAALLLVSRRHWILGAVSAIAAGFGLVSTAPFMLLPANSSPAAGAPVYTLLQMNLLHDAEDRHLAVQRIAEALPDVVALEEMTLEWRETLEPLKVAYPHQVHCEGANGLQADSALLSRRPFVADAEPVCELYNSLAAARIDFNGVPVTVAAHHQYWPWPAGPDQWDRLSRMEERLASLQAPTILAGDFNAAPWSALIAAYERLMGVEPVRGIGGSWLPRALPAALAPWLGLPIDNVLASPGIEVISARTLGATGSDHLPVLVTFTLPRPQSEPAVQVVEAGAR